MIYKEVALIQYTGNASLDEERRMTMRLQGDCRSFLSSTEVAMLCASYLGSQNWSLLFPFPLHQQPLFFFFFLFSEVILFLPP